MTLTLLLDLDDTLLTNDTDITLPGYLKALALHMKEYAAPDSFVDAIMAGTQQMLLNQDATKTLEEVFGATFYPALKIDPATVENKLNQFYDDIYPTLHANTEARPEAVAFIEEAQAAGHRVAITTNPLFPQKAITHRLSWANLPLDQYHFPVVSSFERFHFTKPNPAYFAESLARMGWPQGPTVVVGNDAVRDIEGAQNLGLATFWITKEGKNSQAGTSPAGAGWLEDVLPWVAEQTPESLTPQFDTPQSILSVMQATLAELDTLLRVCDSPVDWQHRPAENQWNLTEILCHFRDVTRDINLPRVKAMLSNSQNTFIEGIDSDEWAIERAYHQQDGPEAAKLFIASQIELIELLSGLDQEDWERTANHTIFGPTTLRELFIFSARHERLHIRQVQATLRSSI